ncbi:hypothetical protein BCR35DRAFT_287700 [Leucosporidium creatinivorum]|uniref:SET domain-containing protein n=1 Tax=Leucosporidium creatinivorum TaxID=106004 RepID=A0A1Y2G3S9_9BASI|nr:hypothetical protein BCR35DRAFT_287700 [Leucosporidium creatinivorum]
MSTEKPSLAARLTAQALSLLPSAYRAQPDEQQARPASVSELTSLAPSPAKKPRIEQPAEQAADFRSPRKTAALPTPSPTSDGSKGASTKLKSAVVAPVLLPTRKMPRASLSYANIPVHDEGKEFLTAGLYYTTPPPAPAPATPPPPERRRPPARQATIKPRKGEYEWRTIKDPASFPQPMYHGALLLAEERDFRLSFDVMRDGMALARPGKGVKMCKEDEEEYKAAERERLENSKKPPPYRSIQKNFYFERKPEKSEHPVVCACELPSDPNLLGCREDCMNRLMQYTCDKKTCPCGARCSNVPLGERQSVPEGKEGLKVVWTGDRGFGLKTMVPLYAGQFVMEYRGEIISRDESYKRVLTIYKGAKSYYFLDYDGHEVIDAGQRGNTSRFINHSCGPNVRVIRWKMASMEEFQMGIFAIHDIPAGTELTYDYGWQDFSAMKPNPNASPPPRELASTSAAASSSTVANTTADAAAVALEAGEDLSRQRCFCGADVCSGFLGGKKKELPKKEQEVSREEEEAPPKKKKLGRPRLVPLDSASEESAGAGGVKGKGKAKTTVKKAVEKMKEVVAGKKTANKIGAGAGKPASAKVKPASKGKAVKPTSSAKAATGAKGPATPAQKKGKVALVVQKEALLSSGVGKKGAKVEVARASPKKVAVGGGAQ